MAFIREGPSKYYGLHKEISNMIMQCLQLLRFFFFLAHISIKAIPDSQIGGCAVSKIGGCPIATVFFFFFFSTNKRSSHLPTVSSPPYLDDRYKHMWHGYML